MNHVTSPVEENIASQMLYNIFNEFDCTNNNYMKFDDFQNVFAEYLDQKQPFKISIALSKILNNSESNQSHNTDCKTRVVTERKNNSQQETKLDVIVESAKTKIDAITPPLKKESEIKFTKPNAYCNYYYIIPNIILFLILFTSLSMYNNIYHLFGWWSMYFSASYIVYNLTVIIFSSNLCELEIEYSSIDSIFSVPNYIRSISQKPITSISMMAHIRGTSFQKWHTLLITFGSFCILSGAIIKLYEHNDYKFNQLGGIYSILLCGIGGLIVGNVEVWSSPSTYSRAQWFNWFKCVIHMIGVLLYFIGGNIAYFLYNDMSPISWVLLTLTIMFLCIHIIKSIFNYYQSKKEYHMHANHVNGLSKWNIGTELAAGTPAAIAACFLIYQFGNED